MLDKQVSTKWGVIILVTILVICGGVLIYIASTGDIKVTFENIANWRKIGASGEFKKTDLSEVKKFASLDEMKSYVSDRSDQQGYYGVGGGVRNLGMEFGAATGLAAPMADTAVKSESATAAEGGGMEAPDRVSGTNVQVTGIDEPDIVKTDGKELYVSISGGYYPIYREVMTSPAVDGIMPPRYPSGEVKLVAAFPPADMKKDSKIDHYGDLLLSDKVLIVFAEDRKIYGFDVSDKANPKEIWSVKLSDRENLISSRLVGDKVYIATESSINYSKPCPIVPLTVGKENVEIACTDIYYPPSSASANVTYNVVALEAETGKVTEKTSFVGAGGSSILYMSAEAIYLTYQGEVDMVNFAFGFVSENGDIFPSWVSEKLGKLRNYDLSPSTKNNELSSIMNLYMNSIDQDEALKIQNEMSNRMKKYYTAHRRDLEQTGIVKIALKGLTVESAGQVPGTPLNQFSLDEYDSHLRVAVTVGQGWWGFGNLGQSNESVSDVYVLDKDMDVVGSVNDMGKGERIYSVRFIEDRGYVVTFKQIDPFYVLDLSSARNPVLRGELKIPGYSSYLHPLGEHKVLGIGREDNQVKVSIFDASSPENPQEKSKYNLNEYWSEALNNHHAFLLDSKHQVFFMPGSQGGYVFSYAKDELRLVKAISSVNVKRAIYLNDYMYLIGDQTVTVLDEKSWEKVKEFDL